MKEIEREHRGFCVEGAEIGEDGSIKHPLKDLLQKICVKNKAYLLSVRETLSSNQTKQGDQTAKYIFNYFYDTPRSVEDVETYLILYMYLIDTISTISTISFEKNIFKNYVSK